jgi:hypothetical protein
MQKSNLLAIIFISIAIIAPLGVFYLMNRSIESPINNFEKACLTDAGCDTGSYCKKGICNVFSPKAECSNDADCTLINRENMLSCCWVGRCDPIDYSLQEWIPVFAAWFAAEKGAACPAEKDCGPAPMCPTRIVNVNYSAKCVDSACQKMEVISTSIDYSCGIDSDCAVKSIQGACGPYPLCVNKDYTPQPYEQKEGVGGICGYADIDGCLCESGTCIGTMLGNRM